MEFTVNYLAVVAAAVAAFAVGAWWYSPIGFGKQWMALMGINPDGMKQMPLSPVQAMMLGAVGALLTAYVLALMLTWLGVSGLSESLQLGLVLWLGFIVPVVAGSWLWEGKSPKLFAFNAAYQLVALEAMAAVLSLWR